MIPTKQHSFTLARLATFTGVALLMVLFVSYILFQARFIISGPEISFVDLPQVVQNERVIKLNGLAENITAIYLNGRPIVTDENGNFNEAVVLENGYTVVSIDAVDLYGRHKHIEEPFVYQGAKDDDKLSLGNTHLLNQ